MKRLYLFSSDIERNAAVSDEDTADLAWPSAVIGIGLVDSAIGTTRVIAEHQPLSLVFLGTCGAYPGSGLAIGDLVIVERAILATGDTDRREMRIPTLLATSSKADAALVTTVVEELRTRGVEARIVCSACTLGITESVELALRLQRSSGATVENLEAFGVLRSCSVSAVPIPSVAVLIVTNHVGPNGGTEWRREFPGAMKRLVGMFAHKPSNYR